MKLQQIPIGTFLRKKLSEYGFLSEATGSGDIDVSSLADEGIIPLMIDEDMQCAGEIYKMSFSDKGNTLTFLKTSGCHCHTSSNVVKPNLNLVH